MNRASVTRAILAGAAALACAVGALAPASASVPGSASADRGPVASKITRGTVRVIVSYDSLASAASVTGSVRRAGSVTHRMTYSPRLVATVRVSDLARLRRAPHVRSVQLDVPQKLALDSSLHVIHADTAHGDGLTGAGTTVAILDTGVDVDHPFLGGRVVAQYCSSTPSGATQKSLCPNGLTEDDSADVDSLAACSSPIGTICDHGTHVAGIAAGNGAGVGGAPVAGVAPGADIIAMQIFTRFDDSSFCGVGNTPCVAAYTSDQIRALDELAALDTAHPSWNIVAANMSLGGGFASTPCDGDSRKGPIDTLLAQGVATVIAAGNAGFDAGVANPGCISSAVTVGATNDDDSIASYSNRGTLLDLVAPGSQITSSVPDDGFSTYNGTSMAAPHVAGTLALLRQASPGRSIGQLVQDLRTTGTPVTYASGGSGVTTPRIDVMAALGTAVHPPLLGLAVAPVTAPEGGTITMSGTWSDPDGQAVTLTASAGTLTQGPGTWSWSATRGDDTTLPVTITATDEGGASRVLTATARWANVAPTAALSAAGSQPWNGVTLAFTRVGTPTSFSLAVTDPGSDDLTTTWAYGDGARTLARNLLHPPAPDAAASPSVEPRAITAAVTHTYTQACTRPLAVRAADDDGGASPSRTRTVVVLGNSTTRHPLAWWSAEYRGLTSALGATDRTCLLSTARTLSTVFPEKRALATAADAVAVLKPATPATAQSTFDANLLAAWLDVASGAVGLTDALDANGDGTAETTVGAFLLAAEATRNTSPATSSALPPLTSVLVRISTTG